MVSGRRLRVRAERIVWPGSPRTPGPAQQVVRNRGDHRPGGIGAELAARRDRLRARGRRERRAHARSPRPHGPRHAQPDPRALPAPHRGAQPCRPDQDRLNQPDDPMAQLAVVLLALFGQMERTSRSDAPRTPARAVATAKAAGSADRSSSTQTSSPARRTCARADTRSPSSSPRPDRALQPVPTPPAAPHADAHCRRRSRAASVATLPSRLRQHCQVTCARQLYGDGAGRA